MNEYLNFHQTNLEEDNVLIKIIFGLKKDIKIGVEQLANSLSRNPKNPNQVLVEKKPIINEREYNIFCEPKEGFEAIKDFVIEELKINSINMSEYIFKDKGKSLYFYIFEHPEEKEESPRLRGVFYATTKTRKPTFWVALTKNLEGDYDRERYSI